MLEEVFEEVLEVVPTGVVEAELAAVVVETEVVGPEEVAVELWVVVEQPTEFGRLVTPTVSHNCFAYATAAF